MSETKKQWKPNVQPMSFSESQNEANAPRVAEPQNEAKAPNADGTQKEAKTHRVGEAESGAKSRRQVSSSTNQPPTKRGLSRLLELAGERKGLLVVSAVLSSLSALFMLTPYISVYMVLRELLEHAGNPMLVDRGYMLNWGVVALGGMLVGLLLMYGGGMASHIAAFRILYGLRLKLSAHIGKLPLGWLKGTSTGAVKKTLDHNVERVETFVAHQLPDLVNVIVITVATTVAMFMLNAWLALACLVPIVLALGAQTVLTGGNRAKERMKDYYNYLENLNTSAVQYVRGMPAVKVFGQTVFSFRQFYGDMIKFKDYSVEITDRFQNGFVLFKVLLGSFAAFILPVGVLLLQRQPDSVALASVLLLFLILSPGISAPMFKIMYLASSLSHINEGVERIDRIFGEAPVPEPLHPKKPQSWEVEYRDVSFSYGKTEALRNISFTAAQGSTVALVGPSGAGKSTVAALLPRFWDVGSGSISIGGIDIREMATEDLMNTVSFVFQDTFLFSDTVMANIAVGRPDASREAIYAAARAAQCHGFISALPNGYDTLLGEGGVHLSGGEEQRIAVARAILKNSPILVLDEATAFTDPENEYEMQKALKELARGKTVIVIAHRLSTIKDAGEIIVMNGGAIEERGTHDELLSAEALYAGMWKVYTEAADWSLTAEKGGEYVGHASQYDGR